jgi:hypothetical protein
LSERAKIFLVGMSKTGTVSYHHAFQILGFKSIHHTLDNGDKARPLIDKARKEGRPLMHYIDEYDVYSDLVLWKYYKQLRDQYPDSYFILNTRDTELRAKSKISHDDRHNLSSEDGGRRDVSNDRELEIVEKQIRIEREISEYFAGSSNFLKIDIDESAKWEKLCNFLGIENVPQVDFPKANKKKPTLISKAARIIRRIGSLNKQ